MNRQELLIKLAPSLGVEGYVDTLGWVRIHNLGVKLQSLSNDTLTWLHSHGYKLDIITNDGKVLQDVNINDAKIKTVYNTPKTIDTLPPNGIRAWRLSDKQPHHALPDQPAVVMQMFSEGSLKPSDFDNLVEDNSPPVRGTHYANNKYMREIKPGVWIDVYDVIECYKVVPAALQHALKKLLATGERGHKGYEEDLIDILSSVERELFRHQEQNNGPKEIKNPS